MWRSYCQSSTTYAAVQYNLDNSHTIEMVMKDIIICINNKGIAVAFYQCTGHLVKRTEKYLDDLSKIAYEL
jgi:hypothetical protein